MVDHCFVLVTGGAGYIGSHACKELSKNGFTPVVFDNLSTGHREFVKWGPFVEGDLLNLDDVKRVFQDFAFQGVLHFAAKAYVGESVLNPIKYYRENIQGTTNLVEAFAKSNAKAFVLSSSCATYGELSLGRISEDCAQNPINPYGFSKLACEKLIQYVNLEKKFNTSILRYFNAAGADSDGELGEIHLDETHVIPVLLKAARTGGTFKLFGTDFKTPDGTAIRDYVHVTDLAKAHVLALKYNLEKHGDLTCNLGTGNGISVLELVNSIKTLYPDLKLEMAPRRPGDPAYLVADNSCASELLGWIPELSSIETIVGSADLWENSLSSR